MSTALYYPYFAPDDGWLKCSLLYWEDIRRIVPRSVHFEVQATDSRDCREAEDAGCLIATDCRDYRNAASREFVNKLKPLFRSRNPVQREWIEQAKNSLTATHAERIHRGKVAQWLHSEKVPAQITSELNRLGLVRQHGDWLEMPPVAAALYMSCLATEMSRQIHVPVFTDRVELSEGMQYLLFSNPPSTRKLDDQRSLLFRIGIRFPRPESLKAVSMKKVLAFRKRTTAARIQFRSEFETFLEEIASIDDPNHFADVIRNKRRNLDRAMRDHRESLKDIGIRGLWSFMSITVPTSVVAASEVLGGIVDSTMLGVSGVALGIAAAWSTIRTEYTNSVAGNPWHYAWKVQKSFT